LFIFLLPLGACLDVDFSCPEEVSFDDEFSCEMKVSETDSIYDLKIYVRGDGVGINRVWDGVGWQRADWYVKNFIDEDGDYNMKLIIHKEFLGDASGQIKLRRSGTSNIIFDDVFGIKVVAGKIDVVNDIVEDVTDIVEDVTDVVEDVTDVVKDDEEKEREEEKDVIVVKNTGNVVNHIKKEAPKKVINLNSQDDNREVQVVYESKNERIKNYMTYGFIFFLICIIGILLYEKQWSRQ